MRKELKITIFATLSALGLCQIDPNGPTYHVKFRPYIIDLPKTIAEFAFVSYVDSWNKTYHSNSEFKFRQEVFFRNVKLAEAATKLSHPESKLLLGQNKFSDQLPLEMKRLMNQKPPVQV